LSPRPMSVLPCFKYLFSPMPCLRAAHTILLTLLPFLAQAQTQSALHPASDDASRIAEISWVLFIGSAVIFLLVISVLALALYGPRRIRDPLSQRTLILGAGIAFPIVVLSALLVYSLDVKTSAFTDTPPAVRIEVTGEMWWWRVRYLDQDGQLMFETANDIHIPAGLPVEFLLKSDNVIHSFWVPNLAGKLDMIPGRVNSLRVQANEPGLFRGQCAEYCGAQHAKMMFHVHVLRPADFQAWLEAQQQPAIEPTDAFLLAGKAIVMQACVQCHAIRGTEANGALGPDLTHIGSRTSLGAGVLHNSLGALAGWTVDSQQIKPGNHMPSFDQWTGQELRAVAHYLDSLK